MKNAMARTVFAMLGMVSASPLHADMPSMERTKRENTQTFGDIKIRQSFSSMKDPMAPDFIVQVYKKGQLLLQLGDASFDTFVASPQQRDICRPVQFWLARDGGNHLRPAWPHLVIGHA